MSAISILIPRKSDKIKIVFQFNNRKQLILTERGIELSVLRRKRGNGDDKVW
jgi:hypothetical protein